LRLHAGNSPAVGSLLQSSSLAKISNALHCSVSFFYNDIEEEKRLSQRDALNLALNAPTQKAA
jgi:hypothetical protein